MSNDPAVIRAACDRLVHHPAHSTGDMQTAVIAARNWATVLEGRAATRFDPDPAAIELMEKRLTTVESSLQSIMDRLGPPPKEPPFKYEAGRRHYTRDGTIMRIKNVNKDGMVAVTEGCGPFDRRQVMYHPNGIAQGTGFSHFDLMREVP